MANSHQLLLAGQTYFVILENKTAVTGFYDEACYRFYLLHLLNCLNNYQIKLHAYVLMANEIWLLATPATPGGMSAVLRAVSQSYSEYFNARFDRSVRIWRASSRNSLIQGYKLALDCQKHIEREPLQQLGINHPGEYAWSSYCANSFGGTAEFLTPHCSFRAFLQRHKYSYNCYREFIAEPFAEPYNRYLRSRLKSGLPLAKRMQKLRRPVAQKKQNAEIDYEIDWHIYL